MPVLILQNDGTPGVSYTDFNAASMQHLINEMAILRVLMDNDIVTPEEFSRAHVQATAEVDQEWAQRREDALRSMAGVKPDDED